MAKEMIVSVNGRERKIAILEDGKVIEFYIERGEENSGVVGNIYKGRVMRVLPGMQSAFVDIGLERDAFLYVSDFFDEEEEFERIVMEKTKKTADVATAEKVASERLQQARLEREQAMEALQERVEPLAEAKLETSPKATPKVVDTMRLRFEETAKKATQIEPEAETPPETPKFDRVSDDDDEPATGKTETRPNLKFSETAARDVVSLAPTNEEHDDLIATQFVAPENSNFERIVDDEEADAESGAMFKDARVQEKITDQVRAIEFEVEPTATLGVGSLALDADSKGSFQRIDDGDEAEAPKSKTVAETAEKSAAKTGGRGRGRGGNRKTTGEVAGKTEDAAASETAETLETTEDSQPAKKNRGGKNEAGQRRPRGGGKKAAETKADDSAAVNDSDANTEKMEIDPKNQPQNDAENQPTEAASRANDSVESVQDADSDTTTGDSSPSDAMTGDYTDAGASVDDLSATRAEMAVRRGGRRRRGGAGRPNGGGEEATTGTDNQDSDDSAEETDNGEETTIEVAAPNTRQEPRERAEPRPRPERGEQRGGGERGGEQPREARPERPERNDRGGSRRPPTITDLLREGQEVLVQIAKEPIARKGARITSHIALPGRYIVYMPTIEHVGVSRKIESGGERNRLRTLIQRIRAEEDVPSGGFIVRTAGIGIAEESLREDARYLVRTWLEMRKTAEKGKSPTLVHQDLDLVQRILRDQMADDFAAIRVDDEAEYLRVIEFVNRIAPSMTNRVKLYTRNEPIMEHYGVQEEIDKAVKPRVWLKSGGYLVINQTEALVSIDVNTGKFVGRGATRLEDTITKTNMEAVDEIARQIRLRDLGGIIVLDLIDMEDKRNRQKVLQALQDALQGDKSPTKVLSFNDFGLIVMTRKRVKQSLERTLCAPCDYCQGAGLIKSPQTVCYEILAEARSLKKGMDDGINQTTLRVHPEIAKALRTTERDVLVEIEDYLGAVDVTSDAAVHQEQYDFAFI